MEKGTTIEAVSEVEGVDVKLFGNLALLLLVRQGGVRVINRKAQMMWVEVA